MLSGNFSLLRGKCKNLASALLIVINTIDEPAYPPEVFVIDGVDIVNMGDDTIGLGRESVGR